MKSFKITLPQQFSFGLTLSFLLRSPRELLHQVEDKFIYKALRVGKKEIVLRIQHDEDHLVVKIVNNEISSSEKEGITNYISEWFDLETDLKPFYAMASKDALLSPLVKKYEGYRIVGQPDLFESLVWAVLGQQINLAFAYTLKQRFVEQFGSKVLCQDKSYFLFPSPETTSQLNDEKLLPLQFSRQKSKYVVLIAQAFASGEVSKEKLKDLPLQEAKEKLMKIKGVGNWTANYALMKTFRYPDAFPLEDAGVHNAIKNLKRMKVKPTIEQVKRLFKKYKGWEAYATLYLWKSL
jgi:DNA-3-methyladenine glycosylase II